MLDCSRRGACVTATASGETSPDKCVRECGALSARIRGVVAFSRFAGRMSASRYALGCCARCGRRYGCVAPKMAAGASQRPVRAIPSMSWILPTSPKHAPTGRSPVPCIWAIAPKLALRHGCTISRSRLNGVARRCLRRYATRPPSGEGTLRCMMQRACGFILGGYGLYTPSPRKPA